MHCFRASSINYITRTDNTHLATTKKFFFLANLRCVLYVKSFLGAIEGLRDSLKKTPKTNNKTKLKTKHKNKNV